LQKLNAENPEVKHLAEKACISYIKSVYLMRDKEVFRFSELSPDKLATSLGLATAPQIGFVRQHDEKNAQRADDEGDSQQKAPKVSRLQKLKEKIREKKEAKLQAVAQKEESEDEEFFTSKKEQRVIGEEVEEEKEEVKVSKKKLRKITKDGPFDGKNKVFFDAQGQQISSLAYHFNTP
jgi:ATP-dependent RNA helicase DDX10/DBP4